MHLARTIGCTVRELKRRMDIVEFRTWFAAYQLMPWGDDWLQTGVLAAAVAGPWTKKRLKPDDFIPKRRAARPDVRTIELQMRHWAAQHNARIEREQRRMAPTKPRTKRRQRRR